MRRNLANWADGKALPQRRNLALLVQVLGVGRDPELLVRWSALLQAARIGVESERDSRTHGIWGAMRSGAGHRALYALAVLAVVAVALGYWYWTRDDGRTIGYLPYAELRVGETVLIHAKRGNCGEQPPEWHQFAHELPELRTGRLIDDGIGRSHSVTCGGTTPGRLVRFVAEQPGEELFELFQRQIKVVVLPK